MSNFFDDIETNKNYFRLNIKKSNKFFNKNNDTLIIKNINSNINKCTDDNYNALIITIINDITKNEHLINLIMENILEKCILHHTYVNIYIKIIEEINIKINITRILNNTMNKYSKFIFDEAEVKSGNTYENICYNYLLNT